MIPPYLGLALFAEGPTDHRFLDILVRRTVEAELVSRGVTAAVSEVQRLSVPSEATDRAERISRGADAVQGAFHLLFIHADAAGDAQEAIRTRVEPGKQATEARLGTTGRSIVGVVPVRETEAWTLADTDALRHVLSTRLDDQAMGLSGRSASVERLSDPKQTLETIVRLARGGRRGVRPRPAASFLDRLAEAIDLSTLSKVPAFRGFVSDLDAALDHLGYRT